MSITSATKQVRTRGMREAATAARGYQASVAWLDGRAFPLVVRFATHPLTISATILLLIPLILFANVTALALILGNYTNVVSASVSSIVLMQSLKHHHEVKRMHAEHSTALAALHTQHQQDIAALHARLDALAPPVELPVRQTARPTTPHRTVATVHQKKKVEH